MYGNKAQQAKKPVAQVLEHAMVMEPSLRDMPLTTHDEEAQPVKVDEPRKEKSYPKLFGKGQYDPEAPTLGRRLVLKLSDPIVMKARAFIQ